MLEKEDIFAVFFAMPMPSVVLRSDPDFTIAEVNEEYLRSSHRTRAELLGKGLFEIFPGDGNDFAEKGIQSLRESFLRVLRDKKPHHMPAYRYDIPGPGGIGFEKRYWLPKNIPILDRDGQVTHILHSVTDITVEIDLREAHQRNIQEYESLFKQHPDVVFSLDLNGYFTRINQVGVQLSERSEAELLKMHFSEFILLEDVDRLDKYFRECIRGATFNIEVPAISATGKRLELNICIMPLISNGRIQGIYGIGKDQTDQKRFLDEKQLIAQVRQIFSCQKNFSDCMSDVLKELCACTGTQVAEAWIGSLDNSKVTLLTSINSLEEEWHETKPSFDSADGLIGAAWSRREVVRMDDLAYNAAFARRSFVSRNKLHSGIAVPVVSNDQVVAVLAFYTKTQVRIHTDWMTGSLLDHLAIELERKKAEHGLNQFFNLSPDMLAISGYDGRFKKVNAVFSQVLGFEVGELTGRPFYDFIHPDDRAATERAVIGLRNGQPALGFENRYISKSGEIKWLSWTANASEDDCLFFAVARDVTEKKTLEKTIESEQLRFSRMFNEAPVSMCILKGRNHIYTNVNAAFYEFTGQSDIVGKSVLEAFPEVSGQGIPQWLDHVYLTGETFTSIETPLELIIAGKREQCYLSFMYQPYKNREGEVEGIFYFGMDVTEQVLARKRIEESERRYMDLIQNLPVAVYTTDPDGKMLLYNKAAVELWGCAPELGTVFNCGCLEVFNPEGLPMAPHERPMHQALTSRVAFSNREILIKRSDGLFRSVLASPSPLFDDEGSLYGGINVLIDITERKKAEDEIKRLSLIARNTDNAVMITDLCGKIEWVNAAFSKLTGFSFEEAVGQVKSALLHGEQTDPAVRARMNKDGLLGQTVESEILNYTKSGRPFWMEVIQQPLFDSSGKLTHLMLLGRDITERKDAYQKLVQSRLEIQSFARQLNDVLEDERARIAREIHDEFGQQLAGLKMYLLSLRNYMVDGGDAVLDSTIAAADTTIRSLRKFATELRPGILDTLGLIPSVEWLIEDFETKSGITCSFKLEGERNQAIEKNVSICCFRICQEALTNILKHSEATFVTVELKADPKRLFLRIADNGIGMRQGSLKDPFSMGLLGMRERAALVGGQFFLHSLPGHGTTLDLLVELNANHADFNC